MIALEWSFAGKSFHIEPLKDAIACNIQAFMNGGYCDYVIMGVFKTDKEASDFAQCLREKRPDSFNEEEGK
jgi:hypothetical protein